MILTVGATGSGKRAYACRELGIAREAIAEAALDDRPAVAGVERLVRAAVLAGDSAGTAPVANVATGEAAVAELVERLAAKRVVICDEVGSGIVPLDAGERAWREAVGRACCELAARADAVVRMVCGIPQVIKGEVVRGSEGGSVAGRVDVADVSADAAARSPLRVTLIRHGATAGNAAHRYIGARTDEPLSPAGCAALALVACGAQEDAGAEEPAAGGAAPQRVYTSGMLRCEQTAAILFPQVERIAEPDLREMDFGAFEGRSAADMVDDPAYRAWVDGGCEGRCPGGEDRAGFVARCVVAFRRIASVAEAEGDRHLILVVHGGTIMALLSALGADRPDYFSIRTSPGGRHDLLWDGGCLRPADLSPESARPDARPEGGHPPC